MIETQEPSPHKLVMSYDMTSMWFPAQMAAQGENADAQALKNMLEDIVDEHARAQVDILIHCVWARFETWMLGCRSAQTRSGRLYTEAAPKR